MPGDRLVFGEDSLVARTDSVGKKTAPMQRLDGVIALTASTLHGLNTMSSAENQLLKDFVQKGIFTDDEEMKGILQEVIHASALEREKARSKEAGKSKPGR